MQILQQREETPAEDRRSPRPRLPKDTTSSAIAVAAVRWTNDQIYGLVFKRLAQSSDKQF